MELKLDIDKFSLQEMILEQTVFKYLTYMKYISE